MFFSITIIYNTQVLRTTCCFIPKYIQLVFQEGEKGSILTLVKFIFYLLFLSSTGREVFFIKTQYLWIRGIILVIFKLIKANGIIYISKIKGKKKGKAVPVELGRAKINQLTLKMFSQVAFSEHCITHYVMVGLWQLLIISRV